ncbi:MAG: cache domain-containing protein [Deltaproteobacteria bacterium]|nr:cache domain-containing protein [Deltaproteobacteria bacterium]
MFSFFNLFKTLRGRLVLLICLAALPTILFVFYVAQKERSHVLTRMTEDGHHLANLVLREHTHQIETAKNLLLRLGEILKYKGKYSFVLKDPDFLPTILKGHTHLANVGILSKEGEVIRSAYPLSRFPNMKDNPAFRRALLSNKVEIGDYIIGPIVSIPILNLAYAIRDEKDATQMVVFNALDLEWLGSFVKQIHLPQEYLLHIVNPQGQILAQVGETTEIPSSLK